MLSGYKTYILGSCTMIWAIAGYLLDMLDMAQAISAFSAGAGMITLRLGMKK